MMISRANLLRERHDTWKYLCLLDKEKLKILVRWKQQSVHRVGGYLIRESKKLKENQGQPFENMVRERDISANCIPSPVWAPGGAPWYKCYKWPRHWILPDTVCHTMPASHWSPALIPGLWLAECDTPRPCTGNMCHFLSVFCHYPGRDWYEPMSLRVRDPGLPTHIGPRTRHHWHICHENKTNILGSVCCTK